MAWYLVWPGRAWHGIQYYLGRHGMIYGMYVVWPGGNNMVYSMAWWAWHGIFYGLTGMAWYMLWPGGHGMVCGIA